MRSDAVLPAPTLRAATSRLIRTRRGKLLAVGILGVLAALLIAPTWPYDGSIRTAIEWTGVFLILVCIAGRTWCSLYISGRKIRQLVDTGPYSISRNPLYVFSAIGAVGVGAVFGMLTAAVVDGLLVLALLAATIPAEERVLEAEHGEAYRAYRARVPRLWPRFAAWREAPIVELKPSIVRKAFLDATVFLAAVPIARAIEYAHVAGWIRPLLLLP
jgi:protein-S-isoprenylcysteine O-methyltransferase Ste14